jgi:hypothetical protein
MIAFFLRADKGNQKPLQYFGCTSTADYPDKADIVKIAIIL